MLTFLRLAGTSLGASLTSPGLFVLLTASAVLIDFGSCATNETQTVVDVPDSNLTAYYPDVQPTDGGWHKVDPTKSLKKPIKVRVNDGLFNIEFIAPPTVGSSAVTLIDGWNQGCQFNITVDKYESMDGYSWTLMQKAPGDPSKDTYVFEDYSFREPSGILRVVFPVAKDGKPENNIIYWSGHRHIKENEKKASVKCVMSTKNAIDDTLNNNSTKQKIASIELSTETLPGDGKVAPLEEMPIVRFTSDEPVDKKSAAYGITNIEITVAATVFVQMLLTALRD